VAGAAKAATPIQHVVVIFQENVSFDHYFATYPTAANPTGEPAFTAASGTPVVNNLATPLNVLAGFAALTGVNLLTSNPTAANVAGNGTNAINPFRLDRTQAATADQDHDYDAEQKGFDNNAMDLFPKYTGTGNTAAPETLTPPLNTSGLVMGYYDGNTVTALWNYAQHFAMSDNSYGTTFGPSAVGAINLISGQTNGVIATNAAAASGGGSNIDGELASDGNGGITVTGDPQPLGDACMTRDAVTLGGKNIGDLLNAVNVSWGFFEGGFDLTITNPNGTTGCKRSTTSSVTGTNKTDYIPHHQPFQFYKSTQNLTHARPSTVSAIGNTYQADGKTVDPANHQYDIHDFFDAVTAGNFPAVSFLKAPGYQDGHAGYSDPLDEQAFVTQVLNFLQKQSGWANTMVIIAYDDSDGWYDHQASTIVNPSANTATSANLTSNNVAVAGLADWLNGAGSCATGLQQEKATPLAGYTGTANVNGRCGHGPRLPFLVVSPYAKPNYVDHSMTDQSSIIRFIEDNWLAGQRITGSFDSVAGSINNMLNLSGTGAGTTPALYLDPDSGQPLACANCD
jgi:phospholipase C